MIFSRTLFLYSLNEPVRSDTCSKAAHSPVGVSGMREGETGVCLDEERAMGDKAGKGLLQSRWVMQ